MTPDEAQGALRTFHEAVDREAGGLAARHAARLQCRKGCADCCRDGITVFEVEAERIRRHCGDVLANEPPHPEGRCAFLDEAGACRIYEHRPYVCRTQGLPLRWVERPSPEEKVEYRDICPLNEPDGAPPVEALTPDECWTLGPFEGRLADLQARLDGPSRAGPPGRVRLRGLFQG